jgi:predicted permease
MILALAGGALGIAFAYATVRAMLALIPVTPPFWMVVHIDASVVAFSVLVTMVAGLVFGLVPALHASRGNVEELRDATRYSPARSRIQSALVVGEVALSVLLLVCAALLMQTLVRLQRIDAVFERGGVVTVRVVRFGGGGGVRQTAAAMSAMHDRVLDALHGLPGVTRAAITNTLPFTGTQVDRRQDTLIARDRPDAKVLAPLAGADVSPDYFRAMGIRLVRGRFFDRSDTTDSQLVVLINERGARMLWPDRDPIGQEVIWGAPSATNTYCRVVGVVADVRHQSAERENGIELYYPLTQWPVSGGYYVVRVSDDPDAMAATIRQTIESAERTLAVADVKTMEQRVDESLWQRRLWGVLFSGFAAMALALAAVGLYGVMSHTVAQRTREIGIRMALGDRPLRMGRAIVHDGMRLVAVGLLLGALAAFGAGRMIAGLLFGVPPHDAVTFVTVTIVLIVTAFTAIVIPAYRAARVDPIVALRSD